jgi:uncharacterized Ntn-hydrolase superfamily protein
LRIYLASAFTVLASLLTVPEARATYSIVAADRDSGEVGGAAASCLGPISVRVIYGSVPGVGAVHAQATLGGPGLGKAVSSLKANVAPTEIMKAIVDPMFDPSAQYRQYGIVDVAGRASSFSGTYLNPWAGDRTAQLANITYSLQGNILTGSTVLDQTEAAFARGCDFPDRLMRAVEAGGQNQQGDLRCTPSGIPADSAFLQVDRPGEPAGSYLVLEVVNTSPANPLPLLRAKYNAWRYKHPCPPAPALIKFELTAHGSGCCLSRPGLGDLGLFVAVLVGLRCSLFARLFRSRRMSS